MNTLDTISQIVIFLAGVTALLLIGRKNKWGFVLGLISVPFWYSTAYYHGQWGILLANTGYAASWVYGFYNWFFGSASTSKSPRQMPRE